MQANHTFSIRDTVRLLNQHGHIPAGSIGRVLGWFVNTGTYVVNFADESDRVAEVDSDEIALAELS
jgi:hypothetical protein